MATNINALFLRFSFNANLPRRERSALGMAVPREHFLSVRV